MTENEAKTKWCPYQSTREHLGTPQGSVTIMQLGGSCIASACMAWREAPPALNENRVGGFRLGHCGLAGSTVELSE